MAVVKNLMVRAGADFSGLYKETKKATQQMRDFQGNLSKTMSGIKIALATLGVGKLIKDSVGAAMQVEASIGQIGRIMGENSAEFENWANTQAIAYGMAKSEALKYGSVYGNLISGFSNGTKETLSRTQDLLKASAIVASATGRTMEDTMDRIRSGLLGNTESIEDLGINVNIAMIESTKAFKKFAGDKSWQQLDFQTQQQIRLYAILEQASVKYGDSVANNTMSAQQQLIAQLKNIQLSLGQAFLPIYQTILPALTSLASKIAYVTSIFAQFMQALFGKPQEQNANAQAEAVASVGDAYTEAGKAASKAAKGSLAGFDEINAIGQSAASGSGSGGGAKTGGTSTDTGKDEEKSKIVEIADSIKVAAEKVKTFMINMKNAVVDNKELIIAALAGIAAGFATFAVAKGINAASSAIAALPTILAALTTPLGIAALAIGALTAAFVYFYNTSPEFKTTVDKIVADTKDFVLRFKEKTIELRTDLQTMVSDIKTKTIDLKTSVVTKIEEMVNDVKTKTADMRTAISTKWTEITTDASTKWAAIKKTISDKWNEIKGLKWDDIKTSLVTSWESLSKEADKIWNGIKNTVKGSINSVIDAVNGFIRGYNSININIPSVKVLGKQIGGINIGVPQIPQIPKLAKGGITNGEMLATIGDNPGGREVVSPLDDLKQILAETMSQVLRGNNQTVILKVGETELGRATINAINSAQRQAGTTLLTV